MITLHSATQQYLQCVCACVCVCVEGNLGCIGLQVVRGERKTASF